MLLLLLLLVVVLFRVLLLRPCAAGEAMDPPRVARARDLTGGLLNVPWLGRCWCALASAEEDVEDDARCVGLVSVDAVAAAAATRVCFSCSKSEWVCSSRRGEQSVYMRGIRRVAPSEAAAHEHIGVAMHRSRNRVSMRVVYTGTLAHGARAVHEPWRAESMRCGAESGEASDAGPSSWHA